MSLVFPATCACFAPNSHWERSTYAGLPDLHPLGGCLGTCSPVIQVPVYVVGGQALATKRVLRLPEQLQYL